MQFKFGNFTDSEQKAEDCVLSYVRYSHLYVPQPDYDASMNAEISEYMIDGAKKVHFSFPTTLTRMSCWKIAVKMLKRMGKM